MEHDSVGNRRFVTIGEKGTHKTIILEKTSDFVYSKSDIHALSGALSTTKGSLLNEVYNRLQLRNVENLTINDLTIWRGAVMIVFNFLLVVFSALLFFCLAHELFERYREKKEKLDIVGSIMFAIIGISTLIDAFVDHTTATIIVKPIVSIIFLVALICCFLGYLDSYRKKGRTLDIIKAVIMAAGTVLIAVNLILLLVN